MNINNLSINVYDSDSRVINNNVSLNVGGILSLLDNLRKTNLDTRPV